MQPELAPIAFIAAFSLLLPLPWHWRAKNVATLSIIGWLFALNMIYAIDAVIWANNVDLVAIVWCDLSTLFQCSACLSYDLSFDLSSHQTHRRRQLCPPSCMPVHLYPS